MMNWLEIDKFLQENADFLERICENNGENISYYTTNKSYNFFNDMLCDEEVYENKARVINLNKFGIQCLNLREMNGCLFADYEVNVTNLTELKDFLNGIETSINEFAIHYKESMEKRNLHDIKEDFK